MAKILEFWRARPHRNIFVNLLYLFHLGHPTSKYYQNPITTNCAVLNDLRYFILIDGGGSTRLSKKEKGKARKGIIHII